MVSYQGGVVPLHIEPLNQAERAALTGFSFPKPLGGGGMVDAQAMLRGALGDPQGFAQGYISPQAQQFLGQAGSAIQSGLGRFAQGETDPYMNTFRGQVTDAALNRLSEQGERARAALLAQEGQRGGRSFGGTATGVRLGELDRELLSKAADIEGQYGFQSFQDAMRNLAADKNRAIQGGQALGQLGGLAQNVFQGGLRTGLEGVGSLFDMGNIQTDVGRRSLYDQLRAGQYIRDYNQGVANVVGDDIIAGQNWPRQNLANTLGLLQGFQSSTRTGALDSQPSSLGRFGNLLSTGAQIGSKLAGLF